MSGIDPAADLRSRWLPTGTAVAAALAALDGEPLADLAAIPMVQPGKTPGIWMTGQLVETVADTVFLGVNGVTTRQGAGRVPVPPWSQARDMASKAAQAARGIRPGTVAYAVVARNGSVAVFEDVF